MILDPVRQASRCRRALCLTALAIEAGYSLAFVPVVPSLIGRHPVLLEALRSSTAAMVAAGAFARVGRASLVLALIAPLPTLMMMDPFVWWAGRLWGPSAARYLGGRGDRGRRRTERTVRLLARSESWAVVLAYFLPVPNVLIYGAAGWTGMPLRRFLLLDLVGTATWVGLIVGLGYGIGSSAVDVARSITHYGLLASVAGAALVLLMLGARGLVARRRASAVRCP